MNSKLRYLTKVSLKRKVGTKWFVIINVLLFLIIVGITNIDSIISFFGGDFNKKAEIIVIDKTGSSYQLFDKAFKNTQQYNENNNSNKNIKIIETTKTEAAIKKEIKSNKKILVILKPDDKNIFLSKVVTNSYIDASLYQSISSSINIVKATYAMAALNVSAGDLVKISTPVKIDREYLDKSKNQSEENMQLVAGVVLPTIILPFFMLIIFLVQTLGAEINEEKTTRGMEIIISNVSPGTHFASKVIAGNLFVLIQAAIFFTAGAVGLFIRNLINGSNKLIPSNIIDFNGIWDQLVKSGVADRLIYIIPLTLILIFLSFLAYSLLAGILASMTTSMEDYQQIQTPIMLICVAGYYLSILAPAFQGSVFIKVIAYLPFISGLLCPSLLIMGQISIFDVFISMGLLVGVIYLMIKYGLRVYKVGILNYSTAKLWKKMFSAIKQKQI